MTDWICGWECGVDGLEMTGLGTGITVISTGVRSGTYCLRVNPTTTGSGYRGPVNNSGSNFNFTLPAAARFGFKADTLPAANSEELCNIWGMTLRINASGVLLLYNGTSLVATGTKVLSTGSWYTIELYAPTGVGTGKVRVYAQNQAPGADEFTWSNNFSGGSVILGKINDRNGNTVDFKYDDFRAKDGVGDYVGDGKIVRVPGVNPATIAPTYSQWTVTGGTLDTVWNVLPPSNTGNSANTNVNGDQKTTIRHNPTGIVTSAINACATRLYGRNGNGLTSAFHRVGGADFDDGLTQNDSGVERFATMGVWATPAASVSALDASEIGVHRTAGTTNTTNMWQAWLEVDYQPTYTVTGKVQARRKR